MDEKAMEQLDKIQQRYNDGEQISDEELQLLADKFNITLEEAKFGLEEGKQDAIEQAKRDAEGPTDEEMMQQIQDEQEHYQQMMEHPENVKDEDLEQMSELFGLSVEELREARDMELEQQQQKSESILTKIIGFIKKLLS